MLNFNNLLYAINLDDERISSIVYALEFAQLFGSRIHIVYVNDPQAGYRHPTDWEDSVALRVRQVVPDALLENLEIVYAGLKGDPAEEIIDYARKNEIDLLIVGHKHRGKLYASMFDSTDEDIVDETFLPVLVVPEK